MLKLGSLFDGSGGWPLAGEMCGIEPVWASEIEPFPLKVTEKNFPNMKQLGDVTKINGAEIEPVDIITAGSPCTNIAICGNRTGLHGEQSVLFFDAIRIVKEMRESTNGIYPKFFIFENVPRVLSSGHGEDFYTILRSVVSVRSETISIPRTDKWKQQGLILGDGFSVGWKTLDAQYWLPQRRKRVFLVAGFTGHSAREILYKRKGLSRDFAEIREEREITSTSTKRSSGTAIEGIVQPILLDNHPQDSRIRIREDNKVQTLPSQMGTGGNNTPMLLQPVAIGNGQKNNLYVSDKSGALTCMHDQIAVIDQQYRIRRLTPLECCRLQGFPDSWTVGVDKKGDAPEYRMWGNGMALPAAIFLLEGIVEEERDKDEDN